MPSGFRLDRAPLDALDFEIAKEKAVALGRMGRALETALARLREFDAVHPRADASTPSAPERRVLVSEAGQALWMLMVQLEACGLRDSRAVMRDYDAPDEVYLCIGAAPATSRRDET